MWIVCSILCMIALTATDIICKKFVDSDSKAPYKLRILATTSAGVLGLLMYAFDLGESGLAPWELLIQCPALLGVMGCIVLSDFLYTVSLQYIEMTIMEVISSFEGIVIFLGMTLINLFLGAFDAIHELLTPIRLILLSIILVFTILLPNIELLFKKNKSMNSAQKKNPQHIVVGIFIALLAVILGCGDSLIVDTLFDTGKVGVVDLTMTAYFAHLFVVPLFFIALKKKSLNQNTTTKLFTKQSVLYTLLYIAYMSLGLLAAFYDAVRSEVLFLLYPVISILGARVFLKEKHTWKQHLCIGIIVFAAIGFCVMDYV